MLQLHLSDQQVCCRSISWLLIPWPLESPDHQHSLYWLSKIGRSLSYMRKDFNYMSHDIVDKSYKLKIHVCSSSEKFSTLRVKAKCQCTKLLYHLYAITHWLLGNQISLNGTFIILWGEIIAKHEFCCRLQKKHDQIMWHQALIFQTAFDKH